jgi:hypothetical protein
LVDNFLHYFSEAGCDGNGAVGLWFFCWLVGFSNWDDGGCFPVWRDEVCREHAVEEVKKVRFVGIR